MHPSKKVYSSAAFKQFWRPFVRVFQALGVSHYSIFHSKVRFHCVLNFVGIGVLQISLLIYILINGPRVHYIGNANFKESPLMNYVSYMSIGGNFLTHLIAHLEPLFTQRHEVELYRRLHEINEIFVWKLSYVTDFEAIRRNFIRRTVSFFVFASTLSFGYSMFFLPTDAKGMTIFFMCRFLSITVIRARRCQIAFHVNNLTNILNDLAVLVKRQQEFNSHCSSESANSRENIRHLRDIYSNAWLVKNLLSSCFGWSFITFLLEFSFELINSAYWAYVNIKLYNSIGKIVRKCFILQKTNMPSVAFDHFDFVCQIKLAEIVSYIASITVNFIYLCKISERCEHAVKRAFN